MPFKFEKLEVWHLALDYIDAVYEIAQGLPRSEEYNLKSQITRAATSIALNIAEGSTGQTDAEQARFLGLAIRSLIETVACQHLIHRRGYLADPEPLRRLYHLSETLVARLHTMRTRIAPDRPWLREQAVVYGDQGLMTQDQPQDGSAQDEPTIDD
jgi:four helix bundle protein